MCCDAGCRKFDKAMKSNGGKYADDFVAGVIAVLRVIPVFLLIILYWAIYSQVKQKNKKQNANRLIIPKHYSILVSVHLLFTYLLQFFMPVANVISGAISRAISFHYRYRLMYS